ncbi:probable cytochrome P450 301a1, mitochondrial [Adelges cooleyi]|uniref:probable cytochrome P450 301a1, mitochondrial n=1 Tax=Adelges cooleyi TaxID=133065 RepID=UPI00217FCF22|nr:probable cytochrome P450 301a1, mitochondrial [Adelges cooleyi]
MKKLRLSHISTRWRSTAAAPAVSSGTIDSFDEAENLAKAKPYCDVPGPTPWPIIGNTWRMLPIIGPYQISDLANVSYVLYKQYGKMAKLGNLVGRPDLLFVYDADEIEKVYRQEGDTPFRPSMPCLVKYKSQVRKQFFGRLPGVVGVHGEPWREFRTKVQKPVLQPQTVKKYIQPIEEVSDYFIQRMQEMKNENSEMPADFDNEIHKWALECIGRVALDARLGCLRPDLPHNSEPQKIIDAAKYALRNVALLELKYPFWRYLPSTLWKKYVSNMDYFIEICMKYIDDAMLRLKTKPAIVNESELSLVERILANEPDPKTAYVLALDLILVGIDTISMAVCSMLYQIATRPEEQEKIYQEMLKVLPNKDDKLDASKLEKMIYLKAFIKEVLRMYSTVIGNGRTLQKDMVICGYRIPKGIQLVFPTIVTGNMEEYVTDCTQFKPERWMKQSTGYIHPFASLPYGHGPRMCLGRRFADLEMQVFIAKLIRSYKLEYQYEPLKYKVTFMYAPDGELKFKMTERS